MFAVLSDSIPHLVDSEHDSGLATAIAYSQIPQRIDLADHMTSPVGTATKLEDAPTPPELSQELYLAVRLTMNPRAHLLLLPPPFAVAPA
jgi:hypothetical protein